ncbi:MAG: magnesium/cobalt transporter CorA [Gemmatimonadetes bacterium]|nr:magnesium/cobalt transporter CorA [Gemmatimonadota bacterium]NIU75932.1 magnesium/cobalt transporter CorA [Gammaproteobacteria bacterium]NIQ55723.1 magnesium/cobalt transporter CorA [Gemmatimonadota bacterium]NIW35055.1 magnesium/cobalt transporter CorA [Gemmatimonadota bacterium]NIX45536.1 magnesium/cobalt transporter CorA [Gemmatimonadota bacterium]
MADDRKPDSQLSPSDTARATLRTATAVPRGVAWTALWSIRKIQRSLRRAGVPLPRHHTFRRRSPVGSAPGTLISHPDAAPPVIRVMGYGEDRFEELTAEAAADVAGLAGRWPVLWIDVEGVGDAEAVEAIGEAFGLHRLALEDVVNVHQRPKVEEYPDHLFAVARMATLDDRVDTEQVSLFLGPGWVLTFQERPGDAWEPVRERLRAGRGRIRGAGADYLFYALLDALVDNFYPLLEEFGIRLELLEEAVIDDPREELVGVIHAARRDALALRHALWPMREAVGQLYREEFGLVSDETRIYLRDAYDHTIQVIDLLENYREMASALLDVYLSSVSHRMNEVMKVLTIIATIFIPLTFIAGIYGMNFDPDASPLNMPELGWYWGYPAVWALMIVVTIGLIFYFRRRRWL